MLSRVLLVSAVAITTVSAIENEERGVFRLHAIVDQYGIRTQPMKLFGKRELYLVEVDPKFGDDDVESARAETATVPPKVIIKLKEKSAARLKQFTTECLGKRVGVVLLNKLLDAPLLKEPIANGEIAVPVQTEKDAQYLAKMVQAMADHEHEAEKEKHPG